MQAIWRQEGMLIVKQQVNQATEYIIYPHVKDTY